MKKERLQELAGVQLSEGYEEDTMITMSIKDRKLLKKLVNSWIELATNFEHEGDDSYTKELFDFAKTISRKL